jgi:hypothetical protein
VSTGPHNKRFLHLAVTTGAVLVLAFASVLYFSYQLQNAELGRPSHLPIIIRKFFAEREYRKAKSARYTDERITSYLHTVALDPNGFPNAWSQLCSFYVSTREWNAARVACERVVGFKGFTFENQKGGAPTH